MNSLIRFLSETRGTLVVLLPACAIVTASPPKERLPSGSSTEPRERPAARATPSLAAASVPATVETRSTNGACPSDMGVDTVSRRVDTRKAPVAERVIDTRSGRPKTLKAPRRVAWARGHRRVVAGEFSLDPSKAVERALAIEKRKPTVLPAGFRERVAQAPRDATLRLAMARCEMEVPATRRRASYDAALAILLGAPTKEAEAVLLEATRNEAKTNNTVRSCERASCPKGEVCKRGYCFNVFGLSVAYISKVELEIEDTLSRALWGVAEKQDNGADRRSPAIGWWLKRRLHKCGKQLCNFEEYATSDGTKLVRWDRRDGGEVVTIKRKLTPREKADLAARTRCWEKTGLQTRGSCLQICEVRHQGAGCRSRCYAHCDL